MNNKIDIIVADPSGNTTIMVLTPVERKDYIEVAGRLLADSRINGEQVAFIRSSGCGTDGSDGSDNEMEMCGLEFCGNASRAFAYYKSLRSLPAAGCVTVKVSGCCAPLTARIDHKSGIVEMDMPIPVSSRIFTKEELPLNTGGVLIDLDGISHMIVENVAPSYETFENLRDYIYENVSSDIPAFGVMFCDTSNRLMTPVVYVKEADTTYFEGSCASGAVAASFAFSGSLGDGTHDFTFEQPEGTLITQVTRKNGRIENISLSGPVKLSQKMTVEV